MRLFFGCMHQCIGVCRMQAHARADSAWRAQARGPSAEGDNSMWACLKRIVDPRTGEPLVRAALTPEMAGLFSGALDTTSQTCAITLCAHRGFWLQAGHVRCKAAGMLRFLALLRARYHQPRRHAAERVFRLACARAGSRLQ